MRVQENNWRVMVAGDRVEQNSAALDVAAKIWTQRVVCNFPWRECELHALNPWLGWLAILGITCRHTKWLVR